MMGKTYIIRVYRCEEGEPESIVGIIEDVEKAKKDKFKGMSELWERLKKSDGKKRKKGDYMGLR